MTYNYMGRYEDAILQEQAAGSQKPTLPLLRLAN
jgi:hypothetical protein